MKRKIIVTVPKLSAPGGVSAFWNALLPSFSQFGDMDLHTFEIGGHGKNIFGPVVDQWRFNKLVANAPDLVFLNPSLGLKSFFRDGLFARRLSKRGIAFVAFFHGWDLHFEKKVSEKYRSFFNSSFANATILFVLSAKFSDTLRAWGYQGTIVVETTVVTSSLTDGFKIAEKYTPVSLPEPVRILFLSRLVKEKGIYEMLDAFQNLRLSFPDLELMVAGKGMEYRNVLSLSKDREGVTMVGHVSGQEKIDLFTSCHIYCLPSYTEGLPTTVIEAMAFGLPIITTPVGGLIDFFETEQMGYFVQVGNAKNLENKLFLLIADPSARERIGRYNHEYAHNRFLSPTVADRLYLHLTRAMSKKIK